MKIKVNDIRLLEYLKLGSTKHYDNLAKAIKPINEVQGKKLKDINNILYDEVTALKLALQEFTPQSIEVVLEVFELDIQRIGYLEFIGVWKYALQLIEKVVELIKGLPQVNSKESVMAGVDIFNSLGDEYDKILIGREYGIPNFEIGKWRWIDVFLNKKYNALMAVYNQNLSEILNKK